MMKKCMELYKQYKEIINYLIVGVLTTVVSLGVYYACVLTFLDPENAIQLQVANIHKKRIVMSHYTFTKECL